MGLTKVIEGTCRGKAGWAGEQEQKKETQRTENIYTIQIKGDRNDWTVTQSTFSERWEKV